MMFPAAIVSVGALKVEFLQGFNSTPTSATSHTISSVAIGSANHRRYILVATFGTADSCTIGGVSASAVDAGAFFWMANVPDGTTADIVITRASSARRVAAVYSLVGLKATIATDDVDASGAGATNSPSINVLSHGVVFGFAYLSYLGNPYDITWGGLDSDYITDIDFGSTIYRMNFAHAISTTEQSPMNLTLTESVPVTPMARLVSLR